MSTTYFSYDNHLLTAIWIFLFGTTTEFYIYFIVRLQCYQVSTIPNFKDSTTFIVQLWANQQNGATSMCRRTSFSFQTYKERKSIQMWQMVVRSSRLHCYISRHSNCIQLVSQSSRQSCICLALLSRTKFFSFLYVANASRDTYWNLVVKLLLYPSHVSNCLLLHVSGCDHVQYFYVSISISPQTNQTKIRISCFVLAVLCYGINGKVMI